RGPDVATWSGDLAIEGHERARDRVDGAFPGEVQQRHQARPSVTAPVPDRPFRRPYHGTRNPRTASGIGFAPPAPLNVTSMDPALTALMPSVSTSESAVRSVVIS